MGERVITTIDIETITVKDYFMRNVELCVSKHSGLGFLTIYPSGNFPTHSNPSGSFPDDSDFWKNLIIEIEEKLGIKVTGMSGTLPNRKERREEILIFYQPKPEKKHLPGYSTP